MSQAVQASFQAANTAEIAPVNELSTSAFEFHDANKRWPSNYVELSGLMKLSDDKVQPRHFDRMDFTDKPDGTLEIYYELAPRGQTNLVPTQELGKRGQTNLITLTLGNETTGNRADARPVAARSTSQTNLMTQATLSEANHK